MSSEFGCDKCKATFGDFDLFDKHTCSSVDIGEKVDNIIMTEVVNKGYVMDGSKFKCILCSKSYTTENNYKKHVCKPPASKKSTTSSKTNTSNEKPKEEPKEVKLDEELQQTKEVKLTEELQQTKNSNEEVKQNENSNEEVKQNEEVNPKKDTVKPEKKFGCDVCKKSWVTQKGLDGHSCKPPLSEEEKQAKKEKAAAQRKLKSEQTKAEKVNASPVVHKCDGCGKEYQTKASLNKHKCPPKKEGTQCEVCEKYFKTDKGFETHKCVPKFHKVCDGCKKTYKTEKGFNEHICELLECKLCNKIFEKKLGYEKHITSNKCASQK